MNRREAIRIFFINLLTMALFPDNNRAATTKCIKNNDLLNINKEFDGNITIDGVFNNLYGHSGGKSLWEVLKWKFSTNKQKNEKNREKYSLPVTSIGKELNEKEDYILWLGHASWLIQIDGKKLLTDPCLTSPPFVTRQTKLPIQLADIKPDYLLVSHGHFDHLDTDSIKHFGGARALIPLKMTDIIKKANPDIQCQEAGWYQQYDLNEKFQVSFLPAHHWHRRSSFDYNEVLWGSFLIKTKSTSIYFGGDSAYSKHFQDIGNLTGGVDIAILPIAAYAPRWFMKSSHINPEEALQAFQDLQAKRFIPMHFGTFDLSDEPLGEPAKLLHSLSGMENVTFLDIGKKEML